MPPLTTPITGALVASRAASSPGSPKRADYHRIRAASSAPSTCSTHASGGKRLDQWHSMGWPKEGLDSHHLGAQSRHHAGRLADPAGHGADVFRLISKSFVIRHPGATPKFVLCIQKIVLVRHSWA
jgi:hypothetical protein